MGEKILYGFVFFFLLAVKAYAVDLSEVDFKYLYDPKTPIQVNKTITCKDDSIRLFLSLKFNDAASMSSLHDIGYFAQERFDENTHKILSPFVQKSDTISNTINIETHFKVSAENNYFIIDISIFGSHYYYDIPINKESFFPCPAITTFNNTKQEPAISTLLNVGDTASFNDEYGVADNFYIFKYGDVFQPAFPPMTLQGSANKTLAIDSVFTSKEIGPSEPDRLFYIQTDSSSNIGISLLSVPGHFPKFKSTDELIHPLIYICTKAEYENLQKSESKKKAFENFWLTRANSQVRARTAIRTFYQRVEKTNLLFSTYKMGWKTDQGMIYIVHGPPDRVIRNDKVEKWLYNSIEGEVVYVFEKAPNLFTRQHYVLNRDKKYYKEWFREVAKWRKGNI